MEHPTRAGQFVRDNTGRLGITTDEPRKRTERIPVMWSGRSYPVLEDIADLAVDSSVS